MVYFDQQSPFSPFPLFLSQVKVLLLEQGLTLSLQIEGNEQYVDSGPPYLVLLHPALGPLWEVIRQKVSSMLEFFFPFYFASCVMQVLLLRSYGVAWVGC